MLVYPSKKTLKPQYQIAEAKEGVLSMNQNEEANAIKLNVVFPY